MTLVAHASAAQHSLHLGMYTIQESHIRSWSITSQQSCRWQHKGKKKKQSDKEDLYALIGLANERWTATDNQIKLGKHSMQKLLVTCRSSLTRCITYAVLLTRCMYTCTIITGRSCQRLPLQLHSYCTATMPIFSLSKCTSRAMYKASTHACSI